MDVFEAILQKLLLCHLDAAEAIHAEVDVPDEEDPGTMVGPRRKVRRSQNL